MSNAVKNFDILTINLSVLHNYFDSLTQRFLNCGSRPQMGSQSKILGSRKFNLDTLHQDLICYAAKNKHHLLKRDFLSLIFIYLKQILKLLYFFSYVYWLPKK